MSYELSFEPPETWVLTLPGIVSFYFSAWNNPHSAFIASVTTDLCIGRRGTLIKMYSCHWNQNHNSPFPSPLPGSKNEWPSCLSGWILVEEQSPQTQDCLGIPGWAYLPQVLPSPSRPLWALDPSLWVWALYRLEVDLNPFLQCLKERASVHLPFLERGLPLFLKRLLYM